MAEVAGTMTANIRVTRTLAEVAGTVAQPDVRLYRLGMHALVEDTGALERSAQDTVNFSDQDIVSRPVALSQTATFSQTIGLINTLNPSIEQEVTFSHSNGVLATKRPNASNTVTFSQSGNATLINKQVTQTVTFSHQVNIVGEKSFSETQTVTFTHSVDGVFPINISHTVTFSDVSGAGKIIPGGIETFASQTVTFSQAVQKVRIKASATSHSATQTVTFSQAALLPISVAIPQFFILSQTADPSITKNVEQDVTFSHVITPVITRSPVVTQTINFGHAVGFLSNNIDLCGYTPFIGENTIADAPAPPPATLAVTKTNSVVLSHPIVTPTLTVTIRAPEFGESQALNFDRINRESRGGTLQIFSDPDWPKQETLVLQFTT
ncbi:MAG: hypothetical protein ACXAEN_24925, partial [Candidatus Thorarchaeota archaeon]